MTRTERRWPGWADVPLPALLLLFGLAGSGPAARNQHVTVVPFAYALVAVAALGLLLWRTRPLWSLAITSSATLLYLLLGFPYGPILFSLAAAVLGVALWLPLRRALVAVAAVLVAALAVTITGFAFRGPLWTGQDLVGLLVVPVWFVIPAAIGIAFRSRREATAEVRAARARRAVSEERLRLAQEVHDVAGHGFAVIAMQAGVALRVLDRDPAAVRRALEGIRDSSREALQGLRAEVEALRTDAPRRPRSGLADLPALLDRMRATDLPVNLRPSSAWGRDGRQGPVELAPDVDHAAYRIVQEALTNVLRHAGPGASAWVDVELRDGALQVSVRDDGGGTATGAAHGPGQGIEGMRQRANAVGGTLRAGPAPEGGFLVEASLPASTMEGAA